MAGLARFSLLVSADSGHSSTSDAPGRRLLFVSNLFPDAGAPYRGLDNATVLHWLQRQHGWRIRVISPRPVLSPMRWISGSGSWICRDDDAEFQPVYVPVPYVPEVGNRLNHRLMALSLRAVTRRLQREFEFDLVLVSWLFPDGCAVAALARELRCPFVMITQGSDTHQYLTVRLRREAILSAVQQSRGVIARSRDLARRLQAAGAPSEKLHPIYNGVDTSVFRLLDSGECRRRLGVGSGHRILLFVGNFLEVKNPLLLVEAFAEARSRLKDDSLRLVMVGKGPLQEAVRQRAGALGVGDRVELTGGLRAAEIACWMNVAECLCLSSRNEGLPNVILEAFACGLPVLATNVGGISEVVVPDENGLLSPEGDREAFAASLVTMLTRSWDRSRVASQGGDRGWSPAASSYDLLLRSCLSGSVLDDHSNRNEA